jgi:hypothetical protein
MRSPGGADLIDNCQITDGDRNGTWDLSEYAGVEWRLIPRCSMRMEMQDAAMCNAVGVTE